MARSKKGGKGPGDTELNMTRKFRDRSNERYGRLTALRVDTDNIGAITRWVCQCDCGKFKSVSGKDLTAGKVRSCGCLLSEHNVSQRSYEKPLVSMPEYNTWRAMKRRCYEKTATGYADYGGRGISVDPRWAESFENFYRDMGPKPGPDFSIERNDTDGNYEPSNCRWATPEEQSNNKRNCTYFEVDGERLTIPAIARKLGLNQARLYWHVGRGCSIEEAINKVR